MEKILVNTIIFYEDNKGLGVRLSSGVDAIINKSGVVETWRGVEGSGALSPEEEAVLNLCANACSDFLNGEPPEEEGTILGNGAVVELALDRLALESPEDDAERIAWVAEMISSHKSIIL